jgi:hypothetical protein
MSTSTTPPVETEGDDATPERLPYVVIRMSEAMKAKLATYCTEHGVVATKLARELLADKIGWDLAKDPDAPGGATRTKYTSDEAREEGKLRNKLHNGLLRKGLYQMHVSQQKKRPELGAVAQATVAALDTTPKPDVATLKALDATLSAAMEAGR